MKPNKPVLTEEQLFSRQVRRRTIISFAIFFLLCFGGYKLYTSVISSPKDRGIPKPFRAVLESNSKLFARGYEDPSLTKEFPKSIAARKVRVNGMIGLRDALDTSNYFIKLVRYSDAAPKPADTIYLTVNDLRKFPKTEVVFNFKCIEGWSQISWWGGVRFSDLAKKYKLGTKDNTEPDPIHHPENMLSYTGLQTPDKKYYVGIDMPSMMHPQTIICYEVNGRPLPVDQGAPVRLIIPVKYGIKHLKKIGTIFFSTTQPPDYWADRGYDYFAGL